MTRIEVVDLSRKRPRVRTVAVDVRERFSDGRDEITFSLPLNIATHPSISAGWVADQIVKYCDLYWAIHDFEYRFTGDGGFFLDAVAHRVDIPKETTMAPIITTIRSTKVQITGSSLTLGALRAFIEEVNGCSDEARVVITESKPMSPRESATVAIHVSEEVRA